ncbi:Kinesin motor domain [Trypanosoma melophagium]|uniref:Kinesin motor domain n=1 Tax=Trypanosoma melophagium TaxID=715481 RepID=UPI00351A6647|nr:Kinesin motor domain [Trypanosoma melophagium]
MTSNTSTPKISISPRPSQTTTTATKVYVRIRPFHPHEIEQMENKENGEGEIPRTVRIGADGSQITILDPSKNFAARQTYAFERCFDATTVDGEQLAVYNHIGVPVLRNVIDGYNGCIFAYGQTGSGKTYTMIGPHTVVVVVAAAAVQRRNADKTFSCVEIQKNGVREDKVLPATPTVCDDSVKFAASYGGGVVNVVESGEHATMGNEGIIPRLARDIFYSLRLKHKQNSTHSFRVEMEYYEIYNEKIFDLIGGNHSTELRLRHQSTPGAYVEGLVRKQVTEEKELLQWIRRGTADRHTACTKMNDRSSRSHAIVCLHIVQVNLDESGNSVRVSSKLNLVDLAGSERTGASGVEGKQFKEATKINLSLTVLGRVIDALADISSGKAGVFCPYRDSNLTWLLMDSLGGNSKTSMVATISPSAPHYDEMCQTLRYASRAKQIVTKAVINEDPQVRQIKMLTLEVARLQQLLREQPQYDCTTEEVEELQNRVLRLEQEISDRNDTINDLQKKLEGKSDVLVQQLEEENFQLQQEVKNLNRTKTMVVKLQGELKSHTDTIAKLSEQLMTLKKEKEEFLASRSVVVPAGAAVINGGEKRNTLSHLHLSLKTLDGLKRLGISTMNTDYAQLLESVTLCASAATEKYEMMSEKNTTMIETHSRALREILIKLENKERSVLATIGEKLIAAHTKACMKENTAVKEENKSRAATDTSARDTLIVNYTEKIRRKEKELANISALLKSQKEQVRIQREQSAKLEEEITQLKGQLEDLTDKLRRSKERCEQHVKERQVLSDNETGLKEKIEATQSELSSVEEKMELLLQSQNNTISATINLIAEALEEQSHISAEEAEERQRLKLQSSKVIQKYQEDTIQEEMKTLREMCATSIKEAEERVQMVEEKNNSLEQRFEQAKQEQIDFCILTTMVYNDQSDILLQWIQKKHQLVEGSYIEYIEDLHEKQLSLSKEIETTKQNTDEEIQYLKNKYERTLTSLTDSLKAEKEEYNSKLEHIKSLHQQDLQGQYAQHCDGVKEMHQYILGFVTSMEHQLYNTLETSKSKEEYLLHQIQKEYDRNIQYMQNQLEDYTKKTNTLEYELNEVQRNHLEEKRLLHEHQEMTTAQLQDNLQQTRDRASAELQQLQEIMKNDLERLEETIVVIKAERDSALKISSEKGEIILSTEDLLEKQNTLYTTQLDSLKNTLTEALESLRADHTKLVEDTKQHVAETERFHEAKLRDVQQEHTVACDVLERKLEVAKSVLSQQRVEAQQELESLRAANASQLLHLVEMSSVLIGEYSGERQTLMGEEEAARVELVAGWRDAVAGSAHCSNTERLLLDAHMSFAMHCAAEHASRVEAAHAALLETEKALESMHRERLSACLSAEKQEREVLVTCQENDRHSLRCTMQQELRTLSLQQWYDRVMDSKVGLMKEHMGTVTETLTEALESLRADHTKLVEDTKQHVAETERFHEAKLRDVQQEHTVACDVLERKLEVAKSVLSQQRVEAQQELESLRAANASQLLHLVEMSSVLIGEYSGERQTLMGEEEAARVELVAGWRDAVAGSAHCSNTERLLLDAHMSFAMHCVAEHASRVEAAHAALLETEKALESMHRERLAMCVTTEEQERGVLVTSQEEEWQGLVASFMDSYFLVAESTAVAKEVFTATEAVLFDTDAVTEANAVCKQPVFSAANSVVVLSLLEQYKQHYFEEFVAYLVAVHGVRQMLAVDDTTSALRDEYEVTVTALEEHHHQELLTLQKENTELRTNVMHLRQDLELMTNLDQLEKEEEKEKEKDTALIRQHSKHAPTDSRRSNWSSANDDPSISRQRHPGSTFSGYISSFFQRQSSQSDRVGVSTPPPLRTPQTISPRPAAVSPTRPPLAPGSLSRANQLMPSTKKRTLRKDSSSSTENLQMSSFYDQ